MPPVIIVALIAAIPGMVGVILQWYSRRGIKEIHVSINSRMDELMKVATALARSEGHDAGVAQEKKDNESRSA